MLPWSSLHDSQEVDLLFTSFFRAVYSGKKLSYNTVCVGLKVFKDCNLGLVQYLKNACRSYETDMTLTCF